jgi:hypothetical protein
MLPFPAAVATPFNGDTNNPSETGMRRARSLVAILFFMVVIGGCAVQLPESGFRTHSTTPLAVPGW